MEVQVRKGPWVEEEDERLSAFVGLFGDRRWDFIARVSGLRRTGKSCRLRWLNYLRPDLKHGRISEEEEEIILRLHARWGNKWSRIARRLPGRTDNEIKNYWRTHLRKRAQGHRAGEEEEEDQVVQGPREGTGVKPDFSIEFHFDSRFSSDFECVGGEDQEATSTNSMNVFPLSVSEMEHDEALASNWASEITNDFVALHPLEEYDPSGYGYGYCSASNCNFWEFCAGSLWDL